LSDPLDYQIADLFSPQKPGWPRMVPALDNGDPGNSVIEHRRICSENRIFEGYILDFLAEGRLAYADGYLLAYPPELDALGTAANSGKHLAQGSCGRVRIIETPATSATRR
jgi:hypothetical protein